MRHLTRKYIGPSVAILVPLSSHSTDGTNCALVCDCVDGILYVA